MVVSTDLAQPSSGGEYRCWLEQGGQRTQLGRMYFVAGVAAWEGESEAVTSVQPGAQFGVSLVRADGSDARTVMTGTLAAS